MGDPIYLDHNSSTPLAPEVFEAMRPYLTEWHGNAASAHAMGRRLAAAVEQARGEVAALVGCDADEIVFTSGGTESNNWVMGAAVPDPSAAHVVVSAVEHFSIAEGAERLRRAGASVSVVRVDEEARVDPAAVDHVVNRETTLVSIMLAQNEVGTVQPVGRIASLVRNSSALMHTDAAQAVGKIPVNVRSLGVDLLSVAGHKLYGPKGVGALYVRRGVRLPAWMLGAPHERGQRAGTLNVPGIVGLGRAATLARERLSDDVPRLRALSGRLWGALRERIPGVMLNGPALEAPDRLPNTVNVSFPGVRSYELLPLVPDVATTAGAACHSGDPRPSGTLTAMRLPLERAVGAVRFSLGRSTTEADVDRTAELFAAAMAGARAAASA